MKTILEQKKSFSGSIKKAAEIAVAGWEGGADKMKRETIKLQTFPKQFFSSKLIPLLTATRNDRRTGEKIYLMINPPNATVELSAKVWLTVHI